MHAEKRTDAIEALEVTVASVLDDPHAPSATAQTTAAVARLQLRAHRSPSVIRHKSRGS
jgi:hypothetical protein